MRDRLRNLTVAALLILSCLTLVFLVKADDLHEYALRFSGEQMEDVHELSVRDLIHEDSGSKSDKDTIAGWLNLELPPTADADAIVVENDYLTETIKITIPGIDSGYFYDYPVTGQYDHITDVFYDNVDSTGVIDIQMDSVYECDIKESENTIILNFINPHEIYDYIVVVDAGHGGDDAGAGTDDIYEKNIDLSIALKLKELFDADKADIGVYYTRLDDSAVSDENRVALANHLDADLFLSIHNNSTASGRISAICGTETMYRAGDESGESLNFANICQTELLDILGSSSKGLVAGDEEYIVRESEVPVALVKIGFMTNQSELFWLNNETYQENAAKALHTAVWKTLLGEKEDE